MECLSARIVTALLGSKRIRVGPLPTEAQRQRLEQIVDFYATRDLPVSLVMLWGATKGYGLYEDRLEADALDAVALQRFAQLDRDVRQHYAPGIYCTIFLEDTTRYLRASNPEDMRPKINLYAESLRELLAVLDLVAVVRLCRETDILAEAGITCEDYLAIARGYGQAVYRYWLARNAHRHVPAQHLPEFQELQSLGWQGEIPQIMWDYYLARAATEKPRGTLTEHALSVALYFGNSLCRHRHHLTASAIIDGKRAPVIKASFACYPPGVPEAMRLGRIEYKVKDSCRSHCTMPPWAGFGLLEDNDVRAVSVRAYRQLRDTAVA